MSNQEILEQFVSLQFGPKFTFRKNQLDVILDILDFYDENPDGLYLLDAPTGSGKSIIAMCVAGALTFKKKTGYILASDLSLQSQYESDIYKHDIKWGSIKGVDNYTCDVNFEKFSVGDCKMKNMKLSAIKNLPCYEKCGYYSNRLKAMKSKTSLLNYSYWLIQRNYVAPLMDEEPFTERDFVICDEAHKVTEIVQNHFSPTITDKTRPKLESLRTFIKEAFSRKVNVDENKLRIVISALHKEDDPDRVYALLTEFEVYLRTFVAQATHVKNIISKDYNERAVPRAYIKGMRLLDWVKDLHCKFEDYVEIIKETGVKTMVKNPGISNIVFNCIDESYLMQKYFHSQGKFRVMMTATMGAADKFLKTIDGSPSDKDTRHTRIQSTFDFTKSPIYLYTKRRMSYRHKEETLPWMCNKINMILDMHKNEKGIIHSGSYDIAKRIHGELSRENQRRVLIYSDSEEKKLLLKDFDEIDNAVLIGPSLLEGLDLKDEQSRFQIFGKVPFPSLADKYVSAKMEVSREWYDWKSIVAILQGIGRSVRSDNDWAVTYFLDGCLGDLISRNRTSFPDEFLSRLKLVKS
jgi:Rad3-related DNA helicase